MKQVIVKAVAGIGLFVGSLIGMLAATGRLNHEGTAGIPGLNALFPAPPADAAEHSEGKDGAGPVDGSASKSEVHGAADASSAAPQGEERLPTKTGRSVFPDKNPPAGEGGGHGEAEAGKEHAAPAGETAKTGHEVAPPAATPKDPAQQAVAEDFAHLQGELQQAHSAYSVGNYFRFDGMPAGITPAQLDDAWKRVQQTIAELDKRKMALDLREGDLLIQEKDIGKRQAELGKERLNLEAMAKALDARIAEFKQQVTIVQADEVPALKRNAETLAAFGPQKGAELVTEQWKTEQGQKEVVKLLELMDTEAVDKLLAVLPNAMIRDVLEKRLHVSRDKPKGGGRK